MNLENSRHRTFKIGSCEFTESKNFTRFYHRPLQIKANDRDISNLMSATNGLKSVTKESLGSLTSNVMQMSGSHTGEAVVPGGFGEKVYYFNMVVDEYSRVSQGTYLSATYTLSGVTDADYASNRINIDSGAVDPKLKLFITNCSKKVYNRQSVVNNLDAKNVHHKPRNNASLKVLSTRSITHVAQGLSKSSNNNDLLRDEYVVGDFSVPQVICKDLTTEIGGSNISTSVATIEQNPYELMGRIVQTFKATAEDIGNSGVQRGELGEAALLINNIGYEEELDPFIGHMSNVEADSIFLEAASKINTVDITSSAYSLLLMLEEKTSIKSQVATSASHVELLGGFTIFDFVNVITNGEIKNLQAFDNYFNARHSNFITVFRPTFDAFTSDINIDWAAPTSEVVYTQSIANILSSIMMISHVSTIEFILTNQTGGSVYGRNFLDHQLNLIGLTLVDEQLASHVMPIIASSIKEQIGNLLSKNGQDDYFIKVHFKRDALFKIAISLSGGSLINLAAPVSTLTIASNNVATQSELDDAGSMVYTLGSELSKRISGSSSTPNNNFNGLDLG